MSGLSTYSDFQEAASSEKIGLVRMEASQRLMGWSLVSGSVYSIPFEYSVISELQESGTDYTEAASIAAIIAGKYFLDRSSRTLYVQTLDSTHPNGKFIGVTFQLFFSNAGSVTLPYDLDSGFEVEWQPGFKDSDQFGVTMDNQYQLGAAIEGSGALNFWNDQDFWRPRYDKLYWENQRVWIYSWTRELPVTEAKIVYRGRVDTRTYTTDTVTFNLVDLLNELRSPIDLPAISAIGGARIPDNLTNAKQRRIYGFVYGHRPVNIDQVLDGYPLSGSITIASGDTTLVGTGTGFLSVLSPDDEVIINGDTSTTYSVADVTDDTHIELTQAYAGGSVAGVPMTFVPKLPSRHMNRNWIIAGHAIKEPEVQVVESLDLDFFRINTADEIRVGDPLIINGENTVVKKITNRQLQTTTSLVALPSPGDNILRPAVTNVFIDQRKLVHIRDFSYSAAAATLTLDPLAEFNVAIARTMTGIAAIVAGNRQVVGTGTFFKEEFQPNDWIKADGTVVWFEILKVVSDTELWLRTSPGLSASTTCQRKNPTIYDEKTNIVSCDVLGATEDGTSSGTFLKKAPQIVKDILIQGGMSDQLNDASFTTAEDLTEHRLGLAIPSKYNDATLPVIRDVINQINQSVMGALVQNADFELEYHVFEPERPASILTLREEDILSFQIDGNTDNLVKTVDILYNFKEYDPVSGTNTNDVSESVSDNVQYLAKTNKLVSKNTYLIDAEDAEIFSNRWSFLLELASNVLTLNTKLQASRSIVTDKVLISHEKLYERVGSTFGAKIAAVQSALKSVGDVQLELEDLSNAFSRCSCITADDALDFDQAGQTERMKNGYITDDFGMMSNNPDTFGINLIW